MKHNSLALRGGDPSLSVTILMRKAKLDPLALNPLEAWRILVEVEPLIWIENEFVDMHFIVHPLYLFSQPIWLHAMYKEAIDVITSVLQIYF